MIRRQVPLALAALLQSCRATDPGTYDAFHTPEDVTVSGYSGDLMEPFLTRDGSYLLFNNRNEAPVNTNLFWARRVDDLTFQYRGEIGGVNTPALEAVPSLDRKGNLYFVSTRSYEKSWSTLYRSRFQEGVASEPELVKGVSRETPGWVNFDAEISADGQRLYFVDSYFGRAGYPQSAAIVAAVRQGDGFHRIDKNVFENVNRGGLQYAPCVSADELELFVTRVRKIEPEAQPTIYRAARSAVDQPFSPAQRVKAIVGFAEAATVSPDGKSLYYHVRVNGNYRLRRVTR